MREPSGDLGPRSTRRCGPVRRRSPLCPARPGHPRPVPSRPHPRRGHELPPRGPLGRRGLRGTFGRVVALPLERRGVAGLAVVAGGLAILAARVSLQCHPPDPDLARIRRAGGRARGYGAATGRPPRSVRDRSVAGSGRRPRLGTRHRAPGSLAHVGPHMAGRDRGNPLAGSWSGRPARSSASSAGACAGRSRGFGCAASRNRPRSGSRGRSSTRERPSRGSPRTSFPRRRPDGTSCPARAVVAARR